MLLFRGYGQMRGYEAWGRGDGSERRERILGGGCVCAVWFVNEGWDGFLGLIGGEFCGWS